MKIKTKIFILVAICLVVLMGAFLGDKLLGKSYLKEIQYNDVVKMVENKEDFILLIAQTTCSHCNSYKPKLEKVAKEYKIEMYYIQTDLMNDEEQTNFEKLFSYSGTPQTLFIRSGEEKTAASRINGNQSISTIKMKLKSNGWINE